VPAVPARAGADIQQAAGFGYQGHQRLFDGGGGQLQRAHFVPICTLAAETVRRLPSTFGQHASSLAAVGFQGRVVGRKPSNQFAREVAVAAGGEREPDIGAFADPVEQAAIAQQLQMARQPRLGLAEDFGELHDTERAPPRQRQQTQARGFGCRSEACEELVHGTYVT
jgi:hypothetical protein